VRQSQAGGAEVQSSSISSIVSQAETAGAV